jgi:hypothetical protein
MTARCKVFLTSVAVLMITRPVMPQQQANVRDAFWSASDLITIAPNPAAHKHPPSRSNDLVAKQSVVTPPGTPSLTHQVSAGNPAIQRVSESGYGAPPHYVPQAQDRLGLRCSIMLKDSDNSWHEVPRDHVFHSGDQIRLGLLGNHSGYFYVIEKGSSGEWSPVYPRPSNKNDVNRIEAGNLQSTRTFQFDQTPGEEQVFIIFSRTEIPDIDQAIQALKAQTPGSRSQSNENSDLQEAKNSIPDAFVQRLASRDLKLVDEQAVNDSGSGEQEGEKAVYVLAKTADPNQEVVLELKLRHE